MFRIFEFDADSIMAEDLDSTASTSSAACQVIDEWMSDTTQLVQLRY